MRSRTFSLCVPLLMVLGITFISGEATAAVDNADLLDKVLDRYGNAASSWGAYITDRASWMFWTLVTISMVHTFGFMALRKADIAEMFAELIRFLACTGFFWWLLINGPKFATGLIRSLRQIGAEASGLSNDFGPSSIVDVGFDIFSKVIDLSSAWAPIDTLCGVLMSAIILVIFALIGVNMLLLLISGWLLAYAGIFFLGFGGSRWTSEMAINYYRTVLNLAVQACVMILLVGIGKSLVDDFYINMSEGITLKEMAVVLVVAITLLTLVNKVPALIGGIAGGNAAALGGGLGAGAAIGAAAMLGAGVAAAGAAAIAGAAGGASAVREAFTKASAAEANGGLADSFARAMGQSSESTHGTGTHQPGAGSLAEAMGGGSSGGSAPPPSASRDMRSTTPYHESASEIADSGRTDDLSDTTKQTDGNNSADHTGRASNTGTTSASPQRNTTSQAQRVAIATAAHLARGSLAVARSQLNSMKQTASDRVAKTTGGRIAAEMRASAASQNPSFGGDGLGPASNDAPDRQAEVEAFRDRRPPT